MRRSPDKTVVRDTFQKLLHKTSFLIYQYTRYRQICKKKQNSAVIYVPNCTFPNCQFTSNSSLLDRTVDILMLYSLLNYKRLFDRNVSRNPNKIWLLWHDKPYSSSLIFNKFLFNWTISYRLGSEVSVAAYAIIFVRNEPLNQLIFNNRINENYKKRHIKAVW